MSFMPLRKEKVTKPKINYSDQEEMFQDNFFDEW